MIRMFARTFTVNHFPLVDLRVGRVIAIEPLADSDKLYLQSIDIGQPEPRQILSGLRQHVP